MGLNISPAIVQSFIDEVFRVRYDGPGSNHGKLAHEFVEVYMDDLIIHSTREEHADLLVWVLKRLRVFNIQADAKKAFIARDSVKFLGHIVDRHGLHMDPEKIDGISKMPPPTDRTGIKRFLGCCGYYRKFIPDFGPRTARMTDLLQQTTKWLWSDKCQAEFEDLRSAMSKKPVLILPRWDLPFIVKTDASDDGMGCLLLQEIDGQRRIVEAASRKWTKHQYNWDVRRKEIFCSLYACRKFATYVQGCHFTLETDHRNMLWVQRVAHTTPQLYRWALELSCLNFTTKHVPGRLMDDADAPSRAPIDVPVEHDERGEWKGYAMATGTTPATPTPMNEVLEPQPGYNVLLWGFGIGCDVMATANTPFTVVGGCETDDTLREYFDARTSAPWHGSVQDLGTAIDAGLKLPHIDVLASTLPCNSRCRLNRMNKVPKQHAEGLLFVQQLEIIKKVNPRIFYAEMTVPDPAQNDPGDYIALERGLVEICGFKHVECKIMHMSKHGAYSDRHRYVVVASNTAHPVEFPKEMSRFPGCHGIMLPPSHVPPSHRASHYSPSRILRKTGGFRCRKIGTVTRGDGSSAQGLHNRLYDPDHPMPTITSGCTYGGNKGSQWVMDDVGPRQWTLGEECDLHNFDDTAKAHLLQLPYEKALGYIARSFPVAPLMALYASFQASLDAESESNPPQASYQVTEEHAIFAEAVARDLFATMPSLDEMREMQQLDTNIQPLFEYHKRGKDAKFIAAAETTYKREAPFTLLEDGVLYFRNLIGTEKTLAHAVLLPSCLVDRVLRALHDSADYGHPSFIYTYTVARTRVYFKGMWKTIRNYIDNCAACRRANTVVRHHAGKPVSDYYYMPFQVMGFDCMTDFPEAENGHKHILHGQCWATGFNVIDTMADTKAETIAASMHRIFLMFGAPDRCIMDQGGEFKGVTKVLIEKHHVKGIYTSQKNPQGMSRTERMHRVYNKMLRIAVQMYGRTWLAGAFVATWCLNSMPRLGTTVSPFRAALGFEPKAPSDGSVQTNGKDFEGLKFDKKMLSTAELVQHLDQHKQWCSDILEINRKRITESALLNAEETHYTRTFSLGDLCLLARPMIGQRSKNTATRLQFQNIGPFEVVEKLSDILYRLRKVGMSKVITSHVKFMNPYLTKEAHEEQQDAKPKDPVLFPADEESDKSYVPSVGGYMLYVGLTEVRPYYVVKVTSYNADTELVKFQYLNNTHAKTKYQLVWTRRKSSKTLKNEWQTNDTPSLKVWKPSVTSDDRSQFCWTALRLQTNADGTRRIVNSEVQRAMRYRHCEE